ncbi:MAG: SUMF1/EgtB/PvdO family nonheme iron enzyme [Verrucomicrobiales bacterium]|nr:SUMF1/EgtB/PvdO family nonheme iron enzyme [Verrucomicrobiales bacterium]
MRRLLLSGMMTACVGLTAFLQKDIGSMVLVEGGPFRNTNSTYYGKGITVPSFYIGKYEVTQKEWVEIMGTNPSRFKGDDLPVEMVTWYECIE